MFAVYNITQDFGEKKRNRLYTVSKVSKVLSENFVHLDSVDVATKRAAKTYHLSPSRNLAGEGGGGKLSPEKFLRGVRPATQNPYAVKDQNLQVFLRYLWSGQNPI